MKNGKSIFDKKCVLNKIEREDESNKITEKAWKFFFQLKKSFGQKAHQGKLDLLLVVPNPDIYFIPVYQLDHKH